jgi:hypothetical protein
MSTRCASTEPTSKPSQAGCPSAKPTQPDDRPCFADTTVDSIVLEISRQHPQLRPGARTGAWCATKIGIDAGGWRPVNRAGHP